MHWNSFRILGDFLHLASFIVLGWRLWKTKNSNGESATCCAILRLAAKFRA